MKRKIELLAPARDAVTAFAAVDHGADAVYMGASSHGARAAAANTVADIGRVADYAHRFGVRVYVTVNTLVYDSELAAVERLVKELYLAGADALIVQDLGLLKLDLPPIDLHASTQCDIRTVERARFLSDAGFSRLVLPREMGLEEIAAVSRELPEVEIEAFCHGALCVCYSGDCRASFVTTGRSANRGECAQVCRLPYDLVDGSGATVVAGKHLLSLRDMNRSAVVADMIGAGVMSFKIEGRLKDVSYVKNTVAAYRRVLDRAIAAHPDDLRRSSLGESAVTFEPDLGRSFNRGFTTYYISGIDRDERIASLDTPKSIGRRVAIAVSRSAGRVVPVESCERLVNGDGLGWFNGRGELEGGRINRVEAGRLVMAGEVDIPAGTVLFRSRDRVWDGMLAGDTARRSIAVSMTLRLTSRGIDLDARVCEEEALSASASLDMEHAAARQSQHEARRRVLAKTGDTCWRVEEIDDRAGDVFIPVSQLASLRRRVLDMLERAVRHRGRRRLRRPGRGIAFRPGSRLPESAWVSNSLAREFYAAHGIDAPDAVEVSPGGAAGYDGPVMTCRYCLRAELGRCLKTPQGHLLQGPLSIRTPGGRGREFRLEFDCRECVMRLYRIT